MIEMDMDKARQTVAEELRNTGSSHSHDFCKWYSNASRMTGLSVREADDTQFEMVLAWMERACRIKSFAPKAAFILSVYKIAETKKQCYNNCCNFDYDDIEKRKKYAELAEKIRPICKKAESECLKLLEKGGSFADGQLIFKAERTSDEADDGEFCIRLTAVNGDRILNGGVISNYSFSMTANAMIRMADENYRSITYAPKCWDGGIKIKLGRKGEKYDVAVIFADGTEFYESMSRNRLKRFASYFYACEEFLNGENNYWY